MSYGAVDVKMKLLAVKILSVILNDMETNLSRHDCTKA
jgi:hypothetical protein